MTNAYATAIYGIGSGVLRYSWTIGWAEIITIGFTWCLFALGMKMWSIITGLLLAKIFATVIRLYYGRKLIAFPFVQWLKSVGLPIAVLTVLGGLSGLTIKLSMSPTVYRIMFTTIVSELVMLPACWFLLLDRCEKDYIKNKLTHLITRKA